MDQVRTEAAKQGQSRYNGKPCRVCGNTERYVLSNNCVACSKEATKKARVKYKELIDQARAEA